MKLITALVAVFLFFFNGFRITLTGYLKNLLMRKNLPIMLFVFISISADGLAQKNLKNNFNLYFGRSFHGTGDLSGICFTAEYGHFVDRKLEISGNITSTMHWGSFGLFLNSPSQSYDASLRYGTAGLQAGGKLGFAFLNQPNHILKAQGGSFVRYQSSSLPGQYGVTFPPAINYPEPVFTFRHEERQNIFTVGYTVGLSYAFVTTRQWMLGAKAGFQNDTNGDVITYYGIVFGKRLSFER